MTKLAKLKNTLLLGGAYSAGAVNSAGVLINFCSYHVREKIYFYCSSVLSLKKIITKYKLNEQIKGAIKCQFPYLLHGLNQPSGIQTLLLQHRFPQF